MPKKIDPLNKKNYTALTAALCVKHITFDQGFCEKRHLGWQPFEIEVR